MNIEELATAINTIRRNRGGYSNAFFSIDQLKEVISNSNIIHDSENGILLIFNEEKAFTRLYFYAKGSESLKLIPQYCDGYDNLIVDVVGKSPASTTLKELLNTIGFETYSHFVRMSCNEPVILPEKGQHKVSLAIKKDSLEILNHLSQEFDPLFSHFPTVLDLVETIEKKEITLVREGDEIKGIAFFECLSASQVCLRYFWVSQDARGKGIGARLLNNEFCKTDSVKYVLWIGTYNETIGLYSRIGFLQDGLEDYILKFRRRENE